MSNHQGRSPYEYVDGALPETILPGASTDQLLSPEIPVQGMPPEQGQETTGDQGSGSQSGSQSVFSSAGKEIALRPDGPIEVYRRHREIVKHHAIKAGFVTIRVTGWSARVVHRTAFAPAPHVLRYTKRFLRGDLMHGKRRTNATFWRHGDKMHPDFVLHGRTGDWSYKPGWKRAATRIGAVLAVVGTGEWFAPVDTDIVLGSASSVLLAYGSHQVVRKVAHRRHRREILNPLHAALAPVVWTGQDAAPSPENWLHVPVGYQGIEGVEIRVDLPQSFTGTEEQKKTVARIVSDRLGMSDAIPRFALTGSKPHFILKAAERPPSKVMFKDIRELLESSKETAPIAGLAARGKPVTIDLEADSPHVLGAAGSGGGKSVFLRVILMQHLYNGGLAVILDRKRTSHQWAKGLPNVKYVRHIEDMHDTLIELADDVMENRYEYMENNADRFGGVDNVPVGPRVFLVVEEVNATVKKLATYWKKIKTKEDQSLSPAVEAFSDLLAMGRQGKLHVFAVAQSATVNALGGPEVRENFATRCLTRYTVNAWKMLVPEVQPVPKKSSVQGRWQIVAGGAATETQVIFAKESEAREFSVSGTVTPIQAISQVGPADDHEESSQVSHERGDVPQGGRTAPGDPGADGDHADGAEDGPRMLYAVSERADGKEVHAEPIGLREAISEGIVTATLDSLRKARTRDNEFPEPVGKRGQELLYDPDELARWERNRPRSS